MKAILAAILAVFIAAPAPAQQPAPLFASDVPLHLIVTAPLPQLFRDRASDQIVAGTLTGPDGLALPIRLKLRGITRRTAQVCAFPPLRVDFAGSPPASSPFAGQNKLKLVTHCRNAEAFQQHLLLEYAAYRMYNLLTPRSFRVRLAQIDYRNSNGHPILTRDAFFIEDVGDVARRNGTRQAHGGVRISLEQLSPPDAARYALFQHMIANHDWSMRAGPAGDDCCHNAPLIGTLGPGGAIPVPYDFDFSGLVGAPYAFPPDQLGLSSVRQRKYRGFCIHNNDALAAARQMRTLRPQLLAVLTQVPGLDVREQQNAASFLAPFFADIASDQSVAAKLFDRCIN